MSPGVDHLTRHWQLAVIAAEGLLVDHQVALQGVTGALVAEEHASVADGFRARAEAARDLLVQGLGQLRPEQLDFRGYVGSWSGGLLV